MIRRAVKVNKQWIVSSQLTLWPRGQCALSCHCSFLLSIKKSSPKSQTPCTARETTSTSFRPRSISRGCSFVCHNPLGTSHTKNTLLIIYYTKHNRRYRAFISSPSKLYLSGTGIRHLLTRHFMLRWNVIVSISSRPSLIL